MNKFKHFSYLLLLLLLSMSLRAFTQNKPNNTPEIDFGNIDPEIAPRFPGGEIAFSKFIQKNLKYPDVALLVGLTGKVYIQFIINKKGQVISVRPTKCLGAGCESEAVRVISLSPKWVPGTQGGKPINTLLDVPISFGFQNARPKTTFKSLEKSNYGFVFFIKGHLYSLHDTQAMLGDSFNPTTIEDVEKYDNPQYAMHDKKAVYMIIMKS